VAVRTSGGELRYSIFKTEIELIRMRHQPGKDIAQFVKLLPNNPLAHSLA
jgi:hypothetical protein